MTSTVSKPTGTASVSWPTNVDPLQGGKLDVTVKPVDQNFNVLTDQYGNPVEIQGPVTNVVDNTGVYKQKDEPLFVPSAGEVTSAQSMEFLRSNPYLQKLVEDRVSALEARMHSELQQGNLGVRKKSGHYNVSETTCAPMHLRWPNESCFMGSTRKRRHLTT